MGKGDKRTKRGKMFRGSKGRAVPGKGSVPRKSRTQSGCQSAPRAV